MAAPLLSDAKRFLLARQLQGEGARPADDAGLTCPSAGPAPLTPGQRQIWRHAQLADRPIYNEPVTVHRRGSLDPLALRRSLSEIVRRHEAWRTAYPARGAEPQPEILSPFPFDLAFDDLSDLPPRPREQRALALAEEDARRPFDLSRPPLFRGRLVRMDDEEHRLYLTLHHIIFDGVSLYQVFLPELARLYEAFAAGAPSPLPEPELAYSAYARWKSARRVSDDDLSYWRGALADLPEPLELPYDRSRPRGRTFRGEMLPLAIDAALARRIHARAESSGTTPYVVLLSVFQALLSRYSGQDDFVVGSVTAGRERREHERIMGFFLNTLPLRARLSGDPSFAELIRRNREVVLGALSHGGVPFERLVAEFDPRPPADRNPLFSVLFSLEPPMAPLPEGWDLTQIDVQTGTSKFDLSLELDERPAGFVGRFIYNTDLFDRDSIVLLERRWRALLAHALECPERPLSTLDREGREERVPGLTAFREPTFPPTPVAFAEQARKSPEAVAVRSGGENVIYAELDRRVGAMASALRARGARRETRIGVCLPRSTDLVAVLLAIGRAGAAYVALDADWPSARIGAVAADAAPHLVVADRNVPGFPGERTIAPSDLVAAGGKAAPYDGVPSDLAYVLYTSGSTGAPKGVMIEHRSVSNLLSWSQRCYPLARGSRVLQKAPIGFDASVWEIFAPLVAGGTLVLAPPGAEADPSAMARCIRDEGITHLKVVPTFLGMLLSAPEFAECIALEDVFCGGEELTPDVVESFGRLSSARLHNLYGPTETCVDVAAHACRRSERSRVPIGLPIDNTELLVLDASGKELPAGIPGELAVAGMGLARGYLGREDLTRERFVPRPGNPSERIYRTGDRVRQRLDGELEFLGRLDHQIKIRGARVEPGEVEAALREHPGVRRAIVLVRGDAGRPALVAYVEAEGAAAPAPRELRDHVSSRLPRAFVPDAFVVLGALPLTGSGKVDRNALPAPGRAPGESAEPASPESAEERLVAGIWSEVLGVEAVGVHDNLFDLGGNSLLVFQITARAARAGYSITPRQLFEHQTVSELVRAAGRLRASSSAAPVFPMVTRG